MESAQANEAEQDQLLTEINAVHERLRPSIEDTYPDEYVTSQQALPTRQLSATQFESILTEFKKFMPVEFETKGDVGEEVMPSEYEYPNFYEPEFMIEDIAEDADWRITEVLYLQLYASWGVLLAENKHTGQWTSFYTVSEGDSKRHLYFDDDVEIINGELIGRYSAYGDQQLAISLDDFTVQKALEHSFDDYPVEPIYDGPIAELDTTSSEFASMFRTRIRNQLKDGADFAGHYSIMMAGCGTECQVIAITNVITGDVVVETSARAGAEYYPDSQLLILDGEGECLLPDICS